MPDSGAVAAALTLDDLVDEGLTRLSRAAGIDGAPVHRDFGVPIQQLVEYARRVHDMGGWTRLANRLDLTHLETLAGALALRCEWDARTAERVQRLQSTSAGTGAARPTLGLAVHLWIALEPDARAAENRLLALLCAGHAAASGALVLGREGLAYARTVATHPVLVPLLLDAALGASKTAELGDLGVRCLDVPQWSLPESWREAVARLAEQCGESRARIAIRCHDLTEAKGLAALVAGRAGRVAAAVACAARWPPGLEPWLLARGALPVVVCDLAPGERAAIPEFEHTPAIVVVGLDGEVASVAGGLHEWRPALPPPEERAEVLSALLPDADVGARLASGWRGGVAALHEAAAAAARRARLRGCAVTIEDARAAVRQHAERLAAGFGGLAQLVRTEVDDGVLVASPGLRRELDALRARCEHRETLVRGLGPAMHARARVGVAALLVGGSGCGKSLAVQWLAHALAKPLLRVDTASVMSKYIGETEKNLARLFAQAEHLDCVLLFDEADALFGMRTDVKQSNDRYANAQTNYLLTRIESFGGIAFLTTNSKARFDDAFMRRLDGVIEFPLPDALERAQLWRAHLGARAPAAEVINRLAAEAELAGGHIRNAVVTAALVARARGAEAEIGYADLVAGIADEYRKLGRPAPDDLAPR